MPPVTVTHFAVAFYLGAAMKDFFGSVSRDLVTPFIAAVFPKAQQTLDKIVIPIGPVKLNIGDAIGATLNLIIAYFVLSMTLPYIKQYAPVGGH
jgi:large-conductance mechanosensitive channel